MTDTSDIVASGTLVDPIFLGRVGHFINDTLKASGDFPEHVTQQRRLS